MLSALLCSVLIVAGCGGADTAQAPLAEAGAEPQAKPLPPARNLVLEWNEAATTTINRPNADSGTPEERQSIYSVDLASVHVAMYDAAAAVTGRYKPLILKVTERRIKGAVELEAVPRWEKASAEAAVATAAFGVLSGLFPSRDALYRPLYDDHMAGVSNGEARRLGILLGQQAAAAVLAARANDGRWTALPAFVPGTAPGQFRGPAIVGRSYPFVRPFVLSDAAQFRPAGPPAVTSAQYAADVAETRDLGGATSARRTPEQAVIARFHTEPPFTFWPRNLRRFLDEPRALDDQARLAALLWVAHADATIACFEAKYHFLSWRPFSAIQLADGDGNDATVGDPAWTSFMPTPPHPEYPAAHACVSATAAETLRLVSGAAPISFDFDSLASASSQHYDGVDALVEDVGTARIAGGMHFRSAVVDGAALGRNVTAWVADRFKVR